MSLEKGVIWVVLNAVMVSLSKGHRHVQEEKDRTEDKEGVG